MSLRTSVSLLLLLLPGAGELLAQSPAGAPSWSPLPKEHQEYLDKVLNFWEFQASQVERYRCQFTRWEYDPISLPRHPEVAASVAKGNVQFAAPDKGLFKVDKLWQVVIEHQGNLAMPAMSENKPQYKEQLEILGEHWVCDGKSVYQFDSLNKQLIKRELPPEMQGKQIAEGPLPFLFGAKANIIKERYWVRVKSPPPKAGHFWLEAIPKRREEAADYRQIDIVIDEKEFLPTALLLYERAGGRVTYEFASRERNWNMLPQMLNPFSQQFFAPLPPAGWKLVNERYQPNNPNGNSLPIGPAAQVPPAGPAPAHTAPRQAQGAPTGGQRR